MWVSLVRSRYLLEFIGKYYLVNLQLTTTAYLNQNYESTTRAGANEYTPRYIHSSDHYYLPTYNNRLLVIVKSQTRGIASFYF